MNNVQNDATVPLFGLCAKGDSLNGWAFRMFSKRLFTQRGDAESYIPEFTDACCDKSMIECAERDTLKIVVVEYELADSQHLTTPETSS